MMKRIELLAQKIKNTPLRKKVLRYLKKCAPKHKEFAKEHLNLEIAPAADSWHHTDEGGLLQHTYSVTRLCISCAKIFEDVYGEEIDYDSLIAAAILHDLMKVSIYTSTLQGWGHSNCNLDALTLSVADLYAHNFPKEVIELVAAHHGDKGPIFPFNTESVILHFADSMDAHANTEEAPAFPFSILLSGDDDEETNA